MKPLTMKESQQSKTQASPVWQLAHGHARTLHAVRRTRWLEVVDGRLWVTACGRFGKSVPDDAWISPGEALEIPAGVAVVVEGWPQARFKLLEAVPVARPRTAVLRAMASLLGAGLRLGLSIPVARLRKLVSGAVAGAAGTGAA